jgi:hypothetical protein
VSDPLPALGPGEAVIVEVTLPPRPAGRGVAWISLWDGSTTFADGGSPALQLASDAH